MLFLDKFSNVLEIEKFTLENIISTPLTREIGKILIHQTTSYYPLTAIKKDLEELGHIVRHISNTSDGATYAFSNEKHPENHKCCVVYKNIQRQKNS